MVKKMDIFMGTDNISKVLLCVGYLVSHVFIEKERYQESTLTKMLYCFQSGRKVSSAEHNEYLFLKLYRLILFNFA